MNWVTDEGAFQMGGNHLEIMLRLSQLPILHTRAFSQTLHIPDYGGTALALDYCTRFLFVLRG